MHFTAMAATGIGQARQPLPPAPGFVQVVAPHPYRGLFGAEAAPYLGELERTIATATSGALAAFIAEPIQGYGGIVEMPAGYLAGAAARVRGAGGLFIADEVQTGFGRTGAHRWGFEAHGVVPDVIVMSKGIANGFPIAAMVTSFPSRRVPIPSWMNVVVRCSGGMTSPVVGSGSCPAWIASVSKEVTRSSPWGAVGRRPSRRRRAW
jgi:4-aminobutyrate aminotransferase-like enzyme